MKLDNLKSGDVILERSIYYLLILESFIVNDHKQIVLVYNLTDNKIEKIRKEWLVHNSRVVSINGNASG